MVPGLEKTSLNGTEKAVRRNFARLREHLNVFV